MSKNGPAPLVHVDDALREIRVHRALHPLGIAFVPTFDVVERGLADRRAVRGCLGVERTSEQQNKNTCEVQRAGYAGPP